MIVEGYNQARDLGTVDETIAALRQQEFDLSTVEIILAGSPEQVKGWANRFTEETQFHSIRAHSLEGAHYYLLKNAGALVATGEILAFTDSDVIPLPTWLPSLVDRIDGGAAATAGVTMFRPNSRLSPDSLLMLVIASVSWGWVMGESDERARGFMDHNFGILAEAFRQHQYDGQYGRVMASPLLFRALKNAGHGVVMVPLQRAGHQFSIRYWIRSLHFRYGYEVYHLRRVDGDYPNRWIRRFGPLEPVATLGWHMMLDVPRWFRYSRAAGVPRWKAVAAFPLLLSISAIARGIEVVGMYATMLAPKKMKKWSENV